MNAIKNKVQLIGHLASVPEITSLEGGKKRGALSIATVEVYKNSRGEKVSETQWHHVVVWGKLAEIAEKYLVKGTEVAIEGKLIHRSYEDKKGATKHITEIQANELLILTKKS